MREPIQIQISRTTQGVSVKISTDGVYTSFDLYEKKDAQPTIPTDLKLSIAGTERSVSFAAPATNGVWYYQVVGTDAAGTENSTIDFAIINSGFGYRSEIKAAINKRLANYVPLTTLISTNLFAGFPQSLTAYPCVIFWLDEMSMPDEARQHYESITLRVKVFSRSQETMDSICDYINQILIDYAYQGKEAVIYSTKKFSETGTQLEADGQTLSMDMYFRLTTERLTLPKIL